MEIKEIPLMQINIRGNRYKLPFSSLSKPDDKDNNSYKIWKQNMLKYDILKEYLSSL